MQPEAIAVINRIDKTVEKLEYADGKGRTHLGASVLGSACLREVWYGFRWAHITKHRGRLLRLFKRGHREEPALTRYLLDAGYQVRLYDDELWYHAESDSYIAAPHDDPAEEFFFHGLEPVSLDPVHVRRAETQGVRLDQPLFSLHGGHYGGSRDGLVSGPDLPEGWGLLEFKTHGEKSFIQIAGKLDEWRAYQVDPATRPFTGKGLLTSKPTHYIQMQIYMYHFGLPWGLYVAVNKNTDDLYPEIIYAKPEMGAAYADRARQLIEAREAPPRISNDPAWFVCRFCDFREICHHSKPPAKSCRSCQFAKADAEQGGWYCERWNSSPPADFIKVGCEAWEPIK